MGALRYVSPEQLRGRADHRSDMFSIGSVFYELLTSRPPFLGDDPMQLLEQLRTEPAGQGAADYRTALADEGQGASLYERSADKEAIEKFKKAAETFAKARLRRPPSP